MLVIRPKLGEAMLYVRIAQVGVVQHIGECSFHPEVDALRDGEHLAETGGEIDRSGTDDGTSAGIAETSNRIRYGARTAACGARRARRPARVARASERSGVCPVKARAACGGCAYAGNLVGKLVTMTTVETGQSTVEA